MTKKEIAQITKIAKETYTCLDHSGHGINGAPYDMRDVYNDMEECQDEIEKL